VEINAMKQPSPNSQVQTDGSSVSVSERLRHAMEAASLRQAEALLRKWKENGSQILCMTVSLGFAFRLRGVVIEANQDEFVLQNSSGESLIVKFLQAREFEIKNKGEGNQILSTLHLSLNNDVEITLIEETGESVTPSPSPPENR
jgi:hypothetical protein